jgi:hypothetical protein
VNTVALASHHAIRQPALHGSAQLFGSSEPGSAVHVLQALQPQPHSAVPSHCSGGVLSRQEIKEAAVENIASTATVAPRSGGRGHLVVALALAALVQGLGVKAPLEAGVGVRAPEGARAGVGRAQPVVRLTPGQDAVC